MLEQAQQVKEQAQQVVQQGQQAAGRVVDRLRARSRPRSSDGKDQVATHVCDVAEAFRTLGSQLRAEGNGSVTPYVNQVADKVSADRPDSARQGH